MLWSIFAIMYGTQLMLLYEYTQYWIPEPAPGGWKMSREALEEVHLLQDYVDAVAQHDLLVNVPVFAIAAFDLASHNATEVSAGLVDWDRFLSAENWATQATAAMPMTWGSLPGGAPELKGMPSADYQKELPPTIWLTAPLRGGAPKTRAAHTQEVNPSCDNIADKEKGSVVEASSSSIAAPAAMCPYMADGRACGRHLRMRVSTIAASTATGSRERRPDVRAKKSIGGLVGKAWQ